MGSTLPARGGISLLAPVGGLATENGGDGTGAAIYGFRTARQGGVGAVRLKGGRGMTSVSRACLARQGLDGGGTGLEAVLLYFRQLQRLLGMGCGRRWYQGADLADHVGVAPGHPDDPVLGAI